MNSNIIILIAEDDEGHYILTKHLFRKAGMDNEIVWLADGQQAVDYLYEEGGPKYDSGKKFILLLDIRMPKIDGIEILAKMKRDDELKDIPVIIVSTSSTTANIQSCTDLGCNRYIIKPIGDNLINAVKQVGSQISLN